MNRKLLMTGILLMAALPGFSWGFYAHRLINYHAVFLLPPEMLVVYKQHIHFLSEHAVDPDKRRYAVPEEAPRHYIDMDYYEACGAPVPADWEDVQKRYAPDSLKTHGIVPWWIQTMLHRLTAAFRNGNLQQILKLSAEAGHYISDAHVPLHTTSNYNGQHTGQVGIHGLWESRLPELLCQSGWDLLTGRAMYLASPLVFTWQIVRESARAADSVLTIERELNARFPADRKYAYENRNGLVIKQYSSDYCRRYHQEMNHMTERRLRQSILAVASFWYTAWVNAGQPALRQEGSPVTGPQPEEWQTLDRQWREGEEKGRSCE